MTTRRTLALLTTASAALGTCLGLAGCGDDDSNDWVVGTGAPVRVNGHAFVFGPNGYNLTLEGATVAVAEAPSISTTVGADGTFAFDVPSGAPVSFSLTQEGFHANQSAAIEIGPEGIARLGFQAPTNEGFTLLGLLAGVEPDPKRCQISTTISRIGTEPYGGDALGVEDAVASIDPPLPADSKVIYFAFAGGSTIYPDPARTTTSLDGGVIFSNVPVGEYTITATKAGLQFTSAVIRCRAGVLVNAAPPNGIQQF